MTTKQTGKRYLEFESSGAVVYKKYGSSLAADRTVVVNAPVGKTIQPASTFILAVSVDPRNNAYGAFVPGKVGIQVYINGVLYYEKYLATGFTGTTYAHPDGSIYSDDTTPWFWKTTGNVVKVASDTSVSGSGPAGSVVQAYY